jgi:hypothetical protein
MTGKTSSTTSARAALDGAPRRDFLPSKKARAGQHRGWTGLIYLSPDSISLALSRDQRPGPHPARAGPASSTSSGPGGPSNRTTRGGRRFCCKRLRRDVLLVR